MAILKIVTFPNPVLKQRAEEVESFDAALEKLSVDMFETMYDAPGVGLAANQIGVLQRIAVIDVDYHIEGDQDDADDDSLRRPVNQNPRIFVNPVIVKKSVEVLFKEGCLSVPGFSEEVKRFEKLSVKYQDLAGKEHSLEAQGLLAIAIQHEIDHLDGKLFIDRLSIAKRGLIKGKIKKERGSEFERSRFHVEL
ncbi:MAG: peptide deformylase [Deltaproteobacteria bacterium]|nr:peptide deformylase [Deltaproteobacteria bacterium]